MSWNHMRITVLPSGLLQFLGREYPCSLGKGGVKSNKREGDGATPTGQYLLKRLHYRGDRLSKPETRLPTRAITKADGWCDDPERSEYNRLVGLPFEGSHELMWRDDDLYDLVIEIGHNDSPPVPGHGSAVFIHIAKGEFEPTEGCIALRREDLVDILQKCDTQTTIEIRAVEAEP